MGNGNQTHSERLDEQEKNAYWKGEIAREFNNLSLSTVGKRSPFRNGKQWSTLIQFQWSNIYIFSQFRKLSLSNQPESVILDILTEARANLLLMEIQVRSCKIPTDRTQLNMNSWSKITNHQRKLPNSKVKEKLSKAVRQKSVNSKRKIISVTSNFSTD